MSGGRSSLINAARSVFLKYGFRQSSLVLVAEEAGLTRQGVYHHFKSKEELFLAVVDDALNRLSEKGIAAADLAETNGAMLEEILFAQLDARYSGIVKQYEKFSHVQELIDENSVLGREIVQKYLRILQQSIAKRLRAHISADKIDPRQGVTCEQIAQYLVAAARGLKRAIPVPSEKKFKADLRNMVAVILAGSLQYEK
jgi:TetR/AcrR family acrAB operon transcriptional repressor